MNNDTPWRAEVRESLSRRSSGARLNGGKHVQHQDGHECLIEFAYKLLKEKGSKKDRHLAAGSAHPRPKTSMESAEVVTTRVTL